LSTDAATIGFWQAETLSTSLFDIDKLYSQYANKVVVVETGRDGHFRVVLNYNIDLSAADKKNVSEKVLGIKLVNNGAFYLGDAGSSGTEMEKINLKTERIDKIDLPEGEYVLDIYSLVTKDLEGNPQYLQFAFNLFTEKRYPSKDRQLVTLDNHLDLKYKTDK
jgi:hypothetical protein